MGAHGLPASRVLPLQPLTTTAFSQPQVHCRSPHTQMPKELGSSLLPTERKACFLESSEYALPTSWPYLPLRAPLQHTPSCGTYQGVLGLVLVGWLESMLFPLTRNSSLYVIKYYSSLRAHFRRHLLCEAFPELCPSRGRLLALKTFGAIFLSLTTLSFPIVMWHRSPLLAGVSI